MISKAVGLILLGVVVAIAGCKKHDQPAPPPKNEADSASNQKQSASSFDACSLITRQEVEAIEESPVTDTKSSGNSQADLTFAQCFYTTAEFNRSVSLSVTRPDPRVSPKRNIKQVWEQTFGGIDAEREREKREELREQDKEKRESLRQQKRQGREEEEEEGTPPKKIEGIGEEAFWSASRVGGALYVLTKDAFVRVSVGGPSPEEKKIEKCRALAQKALGRL